MPADSSSPRPLAMLAGTLILALAVGLLVAGRVGAGPPTRTRQDIARAAFDALKADDFSRFEPFLADGADVAFTLEVYAAHTDEAGRAQAEQQIEAVGGADEFARRKREEARKIFAAVRAHSAEVVDWTRATFEAAAPDATAVLQGLMTSDASFFAVVDGKREPFRADRLFRGPRGWVSGGRLSWRPQPYGSASLPEFRLARSQLRMLADGVNAYRLLHKRLPANLEVLLEVEAHSGAPLIEDLPKDPWARDYRYEPGEEGAFTIRSLGRDGQADTEDDLVETR